MKKNYAILLILVVFVISCSPKKEISEIEIPPGIISPDSMVMIIADIQVVEATLREYKRLGKDSDQRSEKFYTQIFDKYDLKPERYNKSIKFYEGNLEVYYEIYTDVISRLTYIQTEVNNQDDK